MKKHSCEIEKSKCVDSRPFGTLRRRRRICDSCDIRFSTVEIIVDRSTLEEDPNLKEALIELLTLRYKLTNVQAEYIEQQIHTMVSALKKYQGL